MKNRKEAGVWLEQRDSGSGVGDGVRERRQEPDHAGTFIFFLRIRFNYRVRCGDELISRLALGNKVGLV